MYDELKPMEGVSVPSIFDFWLWVKNTFTPSYQKEIDAYLKESSDVFDLEHRMKTLRYRGMI